MNDKYTIKEQWAEIWQTKDHDSFIKELLAKCRYSDLLPAFEKYLPKAGLILEAGAGLGQWVVFLNRMGYNVTGVEIIREPVMTAKKYFPELESKFNVGDILKLDYPDDSLEGFISLGVVEHFTEGPDKAIIEMKRVLKEGGIAIVYVPVLNHFSKLYYSPVFHFLKTLKFLRLLTRKEKISYNRKIEKENYTRQRNKISNNFYPTFTHDSKEGRLFFECKYRRGQLEEYLVKHGFDIIESNYINIKNYMLNNLGSFVRKKGNPNELNTIGLLLKNISNAICPFLFVEGNVCVIRK